MEDFYFQLFWEAYLRYFPVPLDSQIVLSAMKEFGGYDMMVPNLLTGIGILLAIGTGLLIGMGLSMLRPKYFKQAISEQKYQKLHAHTRKYGWLILPFIGLPLGTLLPLIVGFFIYRRDL